MTHGTARLRTSGPTDRSRPAPPSTRPCRRSPTPATKRPPTSSSSAPPAGATLTVPFAGAREGARRARRPRLPSERRRATATRPPSSLPWARTPTTPAPVPSSSTSPATACQPRPCAKRWLTQVAQAFIGARVAVPAGEVVAGSVWQPHSYRDLPVAAGRPLFVPLPPLRARDRHALRIRTARAGRDVTRTSPALLRDGFQRDVIGRRR